MSAQTAPAQVQAKRAWKMPVSYLLATLLLAYMAWTAKGDVTVRLKDKAQSLSIPDIVKPGAPILLGLLVVVALVAAWSWFATLTRRRESRLVAVGTMSLAALATVLGFLVFAGTGSSGVLTLTSVLVSTIAISTPLIFGALSGVVSEHVGVVNIAIEGDLLVGAFAGVMTASLFQSSYLGLVAAPIAGALLGCLLALFSVKYGVDQIIVGVVLNVLALGLTTFFYGTLMKHSPQTLNTNQFSLTPIKIPGLVEIPVIGPVFFNQTLLVYLMYAAVAFLSIYLYRSRWGLRLRACGEHPRAADTVGINVNRTRALNTILGSAFAGLGGAFFTLGQGLSFTDNISSGNGYIALAAMILGKWNPLGAMGAAIMFGFAEAVAQMLPNVAPRIPSDLVAMIPYVVTVIAVAGFVGRSRPPAAENIPYVK
ncbi:branched-chain amino acid transporter permease subunit LivH [Actinomyces bovis]|uniref:Branched-chain amino acid transporter permease subunit LivH n=1 Tax=Actinomyces bovis TaxID=1658 RepID=A0ABY1VKV5_9ACTO|nr:ABC transporter permease [Actinomyces bovis]SPT52721.1 branched-chain amino acid transporter permease subunit LivH [Actinomyces bovis]VEG54686.1 branched-chain amino acid transporter permease subunit LivH [Actinomyces israelii]